MSRQTFRIEREAQGDSQSLVKGTLETLGALEALGATIVLKALDAVVWSLQSPGDQQGRHVMPQLQRCWDSQRFVLEQRSCLLSLTALVGRGWVLGLE